MKTLQINTAQNVAINFKLADVFQRLLAFVIDNVIKASYIYFGFEFFNLNIAKSAFADDAWTIRAIEILFFLPVTFYSLYTETLMNGQTPGKKIMHLKVINIDGFKPSVTDYIIRWFLRIVDFNLFILLFVYMASLGLNDREALLVLLFLFGKMVGFFMILFTKDNQRFGDIVANTIVIHTKDYAQFSQTILENLQVDYKPTYPSVVKLSDNDARIIKETFKTASKFNDYKTLIKLRNKIIEVSDIKSIHKSDREFIDTVLKDYNYYTQNM